MKPWVSVMAGVVHHGPPSFTNTPPRRGLSEGLTGLVPVPVGVHDLIPTEPAEGAGEVEVLQGRPEVLAIPVVDEAADKGLLEPAGERLAGQGRQLNPHRSQGPRPDTLLQEPGCCTSETCSGKWGPLGKLQLTQLTPTAVCISTPR